MKQSINKLSIEEAEVSDIQFWKSKSPEEKLDTLQNLREIYYSVKNESRKGFQKVYRVIKQE